MSDDADKAAPRIEAAVDDGVARARRELGHSLPFIGICHWCESPVAPARVFCCKECADDHEHERRRRKANGI